MRQGSDIHWTTLVNFVGLIVSKLRNWGEKEKRIDFGGGLLLFESGLYLSSPLGYLTLCASSFPTCEMGRLMVPAPLGCWVLSTRPTQQELTFTKCLFGTCAVLSPGHASKVPSKCQKLLWNKSPSLDPSMTSWGRSPIIPLLSMRKLKHKELLQLA